ncbi:pentapeptide repeat-containing protein [Nonomuraea sp. NPDC050202]|uniref:pentapeptide repeat-containing protein n=1 Tax=Nonomuraea sp. NPDC050202 TaxID=3155035 RepID=UPI0033CAF7A3
MLPTALLIGAAAWATTEWLLQDLDKLPIAEQISARIAAARTALAAAAGVGAAVTLMLAVRRQRHQELATAHTTHDAAERRVTELYTKAADQLGNDQAPVRLAGLYALERLAQDTPALRQTIVNVICSYLRMPYQLPQDDRQDLDPGVPRAAIGGVADRSSPSIKRDPQEEHEVRLTAQRIVTAHLRYDDSPAPRRWWPAGHIDPNPRHWPDIRLDLTGAVLIDFSLSACRVGNVDFQDAAFSGDATFGGVFFSRDARFDGASFSGLAVFDEAVFCGCAGFRAATFSSNTRFRKVAFSGDTEFGGAVFSSGALFDKATFASGAGFNGATGLEAASLIGVRLAPVAEGVRREWPSAWQVASGLDGWETLRLAAAPDGGQAVEDGPDAAAGG